MNRNFIRIILVLLTTLYNAVILHGKTPAFDILKMPRGESVILPSTTFVDVPLMQRVHLQATDSPQTLKFLCVDARERQCSALRVAVYDRSQNRVKYLPLKKNIPSLYTVDHLLRFVVVVEAHPSGVRIKKAGFKLRLESDKPIQVAR